MPEATLAPLISTTVRGQSAWPVQLLIRQLGHFDSATDSLTITPRRPYDRQGGDRPVLRPPDSSIASDPIPEDAPASESTEMNGMLFVLLDVF